MTLRKVSLGTLFFHCKDNFSVVQLEKEILEDLTKFVVCGKGRNWLAGFLSLSFNSKCASETGLNIGLIEINVGKVMKRNVERKLLESERRCRKKKLEALQLKSSREKSFQKLWITFSSDWMKSKKPSNDTEARRERKRGVMLNNAYKFV